MFSVVAECNYTPQGGGSKRNLIKPKKVQESYLGTVSQNKTTARSIIRKSRSSDEPQCMEF